MGSCKEDMSLMSRFFLLEKSCSRALPMNLHDRNLIMHVFCLFVIIGIFHKLFASIISIPSILSHLCSWCLVCYS